MIRSFKSKWLKELWEKGTTAKIDRRLHARLVRRLDALDRAQEPDDVDLPGFDFHMLHGQRPIRYTIHVNGPWCITFEFDEGDAVRVDFEQYH